MRTPSPYTDQNFLRDLQIMPDLDPEPEPQPKQPTVLGTMVGVVTVGALLLSSALCTLGLGIGIHWVFEQVAR